VEKLFHGGCQILSLAIEQMSKLFRETPHIEIVLLMLRELGFSGLSDGKLFSANELKLDTIETWAPLLEPFYLPCKAKRYFDALDSRRVITLLRHVLPNHGFRLQCYERLHLGKKRTVYQMHPATPRILAQGEEIRVLFL
jgi:hypothetical protein